MVQQENPAEVKVLPGAEALWQQTLPPLSILTQSLVSEKRNDLGVGSASRISNNHNSTDPDGSDIDTSRHVYRGVANSRRPGWSPSAQAYPPL